MKAKILTKHLLIVILTMFFVFLVSCQENLEQGSQLKDDSGETLETSKLNKKSMIISEIDEELQLEIIQNVYDTIVSDILKEYASVDMFYVFNYKISDEGLIAVHLRNDYEDDNPPEICYSATLHFGKYMFGKCSANYYAIYRDGKIITIDDLFKEEDLDVIDWFFRMLLPGCIIDENFPKFDPDCFPIEFPESFFD
jgi:hypothetical protein